MLSPKAATRTDDPRKVVVTGGAGFIGSHLAEQLVRHGYDVTVLDDLSAGKMDNIKGLLSVQRSPGQSEDTGHPIRFVEGSIADLPVLQRLLEGIQYVFHLAAIPSVPGSIQNPMASHQTNLTGTLNVLLAARDCQVSKVIYASSCAVYGDNPVLPHREDMLPNPQSPYAAAKVAGEHYCRVFHQVYGLPTVCLRYFNVYGPRQDSNSQYAAAIPKFIDKVSEHNPPIIFGDGEQSRDFIFVGDVVEANILAAESAVTGLINIGTGDAITINRLASLIIEVMGETLVPAYRGPRPGEVRHSIADISRARDLGFQPSRTLEEGLRETIKAVSE